jgi:D-aminoacyl-tRNA deacylase
VSAICLCSQQDIAAQTIKEQLLELFPFKETQTTTNDEPIYQYKNLQIVTIEVDSIYADNLNQQFNTDLFIFASRHKSAAFKPALLTHVPGNWGTADLGGRPKQLCIASPSALKIALKTLISERERLELEGWECGLEVTHHGPWIEHTPVLFIEIGSTEKEWSNSLAAEAVARTIVAVSENFDQTVPTVLGFGGPHYCPGFTRLSIETNYAVSHVMPKYHIEQVSKAIIHHAINRTVGSIQYAAIDWKGLTGPQRNRVLSQLDSIGLEARRIRDLLHEEKA